MEQLKIDSYLNHTKNYNLGGTKTTCEKQSHSAFVRKIEKKNCIYVARK